MVMFGVDPMSYGGEDVEVQSRLVEELLNRGAEGGLEPRLVF